MTMRHILVATDGSSGGERALDLGAALARDTGCTLVIVNVSDELSNEDVQVLAQIDTGLTQEMDNDVLDKAKQRIQGKGVAAVKAYVACGQPAAGILEAVRIYPADMVVVGRRGRGQLAGLLLGSVSQKLAALCPCPVIIVP
jgi:nucleotide-binding universal stress UspA family protein